MLDNAKYVSLPIREGSVKTPREDGEVAAKYASLGGGPWRRKKRDYRGRRGERKERVAPHIKEP